MLLKKATSKALRNLLKANMIKIKSQNEIELLRVAGSITAGALDEISKHIKPGISTLELDKIANMFIIYSRGYGPISLHSINIKFFV